MRLLKLLAISFTLYSSIPMPRFPWKEEDMSKSLACFPLVGALMGALVYGLNAVRPMADLPVAVRILLTLALPLLITGGIHLDGFMDVEDALHSYGDIPKKLEILKDPHIGAFAVISLVKWMLLYAAAITAILLRIRDNGQQAQRMVLLFGLNFVLSRCLSGLLALTLQKAKKEGMLYEETKENQKPVLVFLLLQLIAVVTGMLILHPAVAAAILVTILIWTVLYRQQALKHFGGVTGDTAGFYLTVGEILAALAMAAAMYIGF